MSKTSMAHAIRTYQASIVEQKTIVARTVQRCKMLGRSLTAVVVVVKMDGALRTQKRLIAKDLPPHWEASQEGEIMDKTWRR